MNPDTLYDIDKLLIQKSFDALNAGEREFALKMCDTAERYTALREAALRLESELVADSSALPKSAKTALMAAFDEKHGKERKLFSLWSPFESLHRQPVVRLAAAVAVIGVLIWVLPDFDETQIAENKIQNTAEKAASSALDTAAITERDTSSALSETPYQSESEVVADEIPKPETDLIAALRDTDNQLTPNLIESADIAEDAVMEEAPEELLFKDNSAGNQQFSSAPASTDELVVDLEKSDQVIIKESASRSMAPTITEFSLETVALSKKVQAESAFSFKLSNRGNWKQNHYTAW